MKRGWRINNKSLGIQKKGGRGGPKKKVKKIQMVENEEKKQKEGFS